MNGWFCQHLSANLQCNPTLSPPSPQNPNRAFLLPPTCPDPLSLSNPPLNHPGSEDGLASPPPTPAPLHWCLAPTCPVSALTPPGISPPPLPPQGALLPSDARPTARESEATELTLFCAARVQLYYGGRGDIRGTSGMGVVVWARTRRVRIKDGGASPKGQSEGRPERLRLLSWSPGPRIPPPHRLIALSWSNLASSPRSHAKAPGLQTPPPLRQTGSLTRLEITLAVRDTNLVQRGFPAQPR